MGRLTDEMAQLRRNIDGSREARLVQQNARVSDVCRQIADFAADRVRNGEQDGRVRAAFVADNANGIKRLLNDFRHTRQVAGQQAHEDRAAFVSGVSKNTQDLLGDFNTARKSMAERCGKDRADFLANLTNGVAAFINEAAQDRVGANAVFFGVAASKKKNNISSITIHLIDEAVQGESDQGGADQFAVSVSEEAAELGHTDIFESKKSKKRHKAD